MSNNKKLIRIKNELNAIGPGMCLAKWKQVTVHLSTGHTHSCHHPKTHLIPVEEISIDPSALHNTSYKKEMRRQMLNGERPSECQYCWNVEDKTNQLEIFSDRILKSADPYCLDFKDEVIAAGWQHNINPSYLEVSFSYGCNFKCSYCSPEISSKWMEEIQQHGPYPTSRQFNNIEWFKADNKMPIPEREENPFVEAFWKWWPSLYPSLHTFRITGGEPLMTKHTFKVLDYIIKNPNTQLELAINSNLGVPDKLFDDFLKKIKIIEQNRSVKKITIFTSCEAYGKKAEYIRHGLNYDKWLSNCELLLKEMPQVELVLMSTYNALSVTTYTKFLEDWLMLKKKYAVIQGPNRRRIDISIPYLRNPEWLTMGILTDDFLYSARQSLNFMKQNSLYFLEYEIQYMQRIYSLFESLMKEPMPNLTTWRKDFVAFVDEHDRRRGTNFLETFPEYSNFYEQCKLIIR